MGLLSDNSRSKERQSVTLISKTPPNSMVELIKAHIPIIVIIDPHEIDILYDCTDTLKDNNANNEQPADTAKYFRVDGRG
uniref:Uncharacterized protein n=1 Tax=Romanomermis culicivorax TaxID=13658 RepID=A0A915KZP2_ROMCU